MNMQVYFAEINPELKIPKLWLDFTLNIPLYLKHFIIYLLFVPCVENYGMYLRQLI